MILKNGLFLLLSMLITETFASEYTPAQLIDKGATSYETTAQRNRIEWWAQISFVIDKYGRAGNVEFLELSQKTGTAEMEKIKLHISRLKYSPAIYADESILSTQTTLYKRDISFNGNSNDGISVGFKNTYNEVNALLVSGKLKKTTEKLASLQNDHTKNLVEQSLYYWLSSIYFYKKEDWDKYGEAVKKAFLLRGFLPNKMVIKTINNLVDYYIFKHEYKLAIQAASSFKKIDWIDNGEEAYLAYYERVLETIKQQKQVIINYKVERSTSKYIGLSLGVVELNLIAGSFEKIEIRCKNSLRQIPVQTDVKITIGKNEFDCGLLVKGEVDATFSVKQQGRILI